WLDPAKTSPYDFFQYWRNVDDADVLNCLKMLTFLPVEEIEGYAGLQGSELNPVKEKLAFEVTRLIHGEDEAQKAMKAANALFTCGNADGDMPETCLCGDIFEGGKANIVNVLVAAGLAKSKGEARRLIEQGGVTCGSEKVSSFDFCLCTSDLEREPVI